MIGAVKAAVNHHDGGGGGGAGGGAGDVSGFFFFFLFFLFFFLKKKDSKTEKGERRKKKEKKQKKRRRKGKGEAGVWGNGQSNPYDDDLSKSFFKPSARRLNRSRADKGVPPCRRSVHFHRSRRSPVSNYNVPSFGKSLEPILQWSGDSRLLFTTALECAPSRSRWRRGYSVW
ncbi:hypothetical protein F4780DRAFT_700855 [Xylariomycetidae sp. FL0641]|nr:hypothetical protein F4780DRAFT_700855 [Xylariomycetidae sp. FL0641]